METSRPSILALAEGALLPFLGLTGQSLLRPFRGLVFLKMEFRLKQLAEVSTFHYVKAQLINRSITGKRLCHRAML